jgi:hypothetical protein
MTPLLPPLEVGHERGEVGLELVRAFKRISHRAVVRAALADPSHPPTLHLARDESAERVADAFGVRELPEVPPDVVSDPDPGLAISDRRRRRSAQIRAGSSAAPSSRPISVAGTLVGPSPVFTYSGHRAGKCVPGRGGRKCEDV